MVATRHLPPSTPARCIRKSARRCIGACERWADVVAGWFVLFVVLIALTTFLVWGLVGPQPSRAYGLINAVAVLIIASPCVLGLATPMSVMVATGKVVTQGVLFRDAAAIESLRKVDTLIVDKTGTLTEGRPAFHGVMAAPGWTEADLLRIAASLDQGSEHPLALMFGLTRTSGATASLLLNLEAVFTAMIAWVVFKENADRRIVLGMLAIVAGGVVLSWSARYAATNDWLGPLAIVLACLCWAIDNNLTRRISASDALFVAGAKGAMAGSVNVGLAFALGASLPAGPVLLGTLAVGLLGYGVSLVLFVLALRGLGTARTGAYFSTAPFIGAAVSLALLGESTSTAFWIAAALMAWGVWLHLTEHHEHEHVHEPMEHSHRHVHDVHHRHAHPFPWAGDEPHEHWHRHELLVHKHPHFPDIHHRHSH
jgi:drug/metabolite transporter (DMT)-like permease